MACTPIGGCFQTSREVSVAQVLPAAGAFTSQSFTSLVTGTKRLTFWIQYVRGGPNGAPAFRLEGTNGVEAARQLIQEDASFAVAQPNATVNVEMETLLGPVPADGTAITYKLPYIVDAGESGVRLLAAEVGNPGAPGTISIAVTGDGGC